MGHQPPPTSGDDIFCIGCGYSLRGLPGNRCPECGREFDPNDPETMSHARPLRAWQRWFLKPAGWPTITLALAGSALLVYLGWRPNWRPEPPTVLFHEFTWRVGWLRPFTLPDVVFYAAMVLWLAFLLSLGFRQFARLLVPRVARRANRQAHSRRHRQVIAFAVAISVLFMLFGWEARIGRRWMARARGDVSLVNYRGNPWRWLPRALSPVQLSPQEAQDVLSDAMLDLPTAQDRQCAMRLLVASTGAAALPALTRAAARDTDAALLVWELRVIGLCRDPATSPMLIRRLQDPRPEVRAAAADAIGILRKPSYAIDAPSWDAWRHRELSLDTSPPTPLETMITPDGSGADDRNLQDDAANCVSWSVRTTLEQMMLRGATLQEREAAARSLVNWPPDHYHLRVAEWGVWIDNSGSLALAKSVIAEIPAFVHGTGNDVSSFSSYFLYPAVITKPIVHVTSDVPLAADLEVHIRQGRPWLAYPKPDDFGVSTTDEVRDGSSLGFCPPWGPSATSQKDDLTSPQISKLTECREGYPWLLPHHRQYPPNGMLGGAYIYRLGLRWQSLIVSPDRLSWMKLPTVSSDPKFGWWTTLRSVPSSWVTSRGETERFIYYDGPTRAETPISAHLDAAGTQLTFTAADIQPPYGGYNNSGVAYVFHPLAPTPKPGLAEHEGLYVQVHNGVLQGQYVLPDPAVVVGLDATLPLQGQAVLDRFRRMLLDYGLTAPEAEGLIRVWMPQFFRTEGRRFILRLSPREYARQCPLQMRPAPTELVRLGLVLSEFDAPTATEPSMRTR